MKSFLSFSLTDLLSFFLSLCRVISIVSFTLSLRVPSPERRREGKQNENGFFKRRKNPLPAEEGTFCLALPEALPEVRNIPYGKILVSHMKKVMRNQVILMWHVNLRYFTVNVKSLRYRDTSLISLVNYIRI